MTDRKIVGGPKNFRQGTLVYRVTFSFPPDVKEKVFQTIFVTDKIKTCQSCVGVRKKIRCNHLLPHCRFAGRLSFHPAGARPRRRYCRRGVGCGSRGWNGGTTVSL